MLLRAAPTGKAGGEGGTQLPGLHEEGEVPGDDLAADPDRLVSGVAQETSVHWDLLPVVLIGPPDVVPEALDGQTEVDVEGVIERLPVIQRLQAGQVHPVPLNQLGQLQQEISSLRGVHRPPGAAQFEGLSGGLDSHVNIGLVALRHLADHLAGGGVDGGERLAGY